ncbi:hypothetical protein BAUCODRAFT_110130 [Baudoinia panamericana UAMH 10762]|uniref:Ubiquinone biosynthesis monooxygenase COQ6, mitochondrial n=1 Tax=Baudoinia panamericana (strain UAMH 10762) TaxID=717646 RepID=M2N855_BAUPA|nr:uncharacterized protein BAUCODRAFT_110130 [Baudoinia panamericana UAMH 10762]EMC94980.1 hypothetical protein BAUCODRAFT_110130 [Baudoinia panamericana UAMH 10762]
MALTRSVAFRKLLALPPDVRRRLWSSAVSVTPGKPDIYDVVCIGGGPAGLSFASALKAHSATRALKVALIDAQDITTSRTGNDGDAYSNRCSSLTPASSRFLRKIGAWDHINTGRVQPYHAMDVWDGVSGSKIHFDPRRYEAGSDYGVVATMCENGNLTAALLQRLQALTTGDAGAGSVCDILDKTKVESIELGPQPETEETVDLSQWPIVMTSQGQLAARLLVGADGANSPVRQFVDIPSHGWDYGQHGVVATLELEQTFAADEVRTAFQRFLPTGPIALLPLPGNKASLVWSTSPQHAAKLKQLPPNDFVAMVSAAFRLMPVDVNFMLSPDMAVTPSEELRWREPATSPSSTGLPSTFPWITGVQEGSIASFPLRMRHADTYTGHRVALIGDAAHTIHPLAGQGLNLGLADAEALANQITYGMEHGMDIGSSWCLDGYNSERWAANNAMLGVVDKLQKLYSASAGPVVWSRSLGLEAVERMSWVKGALMGVAAGAK